MLKCAHTSVELYAMIITKQMLAGNGNLLVIKSISVDSRENILGKMWWREQVKKCLDMRIFCAVNLSFKCTINI